MPELLSAILDLFLHVDERLGAVIASYGGWTYGILFLIIFCETGLVLTPFLPGDSLLFAVGAFAAAGTLDLATAMVILCAAAILGDTVNYAIGRAIGPKVFASPGNRVFKREYLERTRRFYEKHGAKTIVLARFVPIVRTFAPFVAGVGQMRYGTFFAYNVTGGVLWVVLLTLAGYFFGGIPWVKAHFEAVVVAIIAISVLPMVIEAVQHRRGKHDRFMKPR